MNIYYDFEFLEQGWHSPLLPISLGMARDDGEEYYGIVKDHHTVTLAVRHPWLREHVIPQLPVKVTSRAPLGWTWDKDHPDHKRLADRETLAAAVRGFILAASGPQLWGWYCAYDHVLLAQLFGRMTDLPEGIPMHSNDLKQETGETELPPMPGVQEHNALSDAREIRWRYHYYAHNFTVHGICPCGFGGKCKVI